MIADCLMRNSYSAAEPLKLRTKQDAQKKKKSMLKAQAKIKMAFAEVIMRKLKKIFFSREFLLNQGLLPLSPTIEG